MVAVLRNFFDVFRSCGVPKKSVVIILASSIITIFFEILGIGVFIPIIEILSNNSEFDLFGKKFRCNHDKISLYLLMAGGLLFIMSAKSFVLVLNSYLLVQFWSLVNENLKCFETY